VVQSGSASSITVNTARVELERRFVSFQSNGNWVGGNSGFQRSITVDSHVLEGRNGGSDGFSRRSASALLGRVHVVGFSRDSFVLDHVLEGAVHPTTVATLVALGTRTVHQLLFGQRHQRVAFDRPHSLNRTSGRERPAGPALALVLNSSDSFGTPVNAGWVGLGSSFLRSILRTNVGVVNVNVAGVGRRKFSRRQITERVHPHSEARVATVVLRNEVQIRLEHVVALEEHVVCVLLAVVSHEPNKRILVLFFREQPARSHH